MSRPTLAARGTSPGAAGRYGDNADRDFRMLIGGDWVASQSGGTFPCVDPFTEESWGRIPLADAVDADRAVHAARRAFDSGGWPQTAPARRAALLRKLAQLMEQNADELARRQILENGKLISEMRLGVDVLVSSCHFFAGLAETLSGMTLPVSIPNVFSYTVREPIGVVAAITPWNSPLLLLAWKLFPALAAGNTVVIKPSEVTPTSTLLLGELIVKAGFPAGVVNIVTGFGIPTGAALASHPGVDKIAFTGSTATGRAIAHAAAERNARFTLELGGKSPNIIFADADIGNAVNGVMAGIFAATGQTCMAGSRVLVESRVYQQTAELLVDRGRRIRAGDPLDPATQLGPLASRAQLDKVLGYFDIARNEGLELLSGGRRIDCKGFFVEPTIYGNVDNHCRLAREEIFGPVAALIRFEDEEQAVALANDTPYGLAAGVWTENAQRAQRMVQRLRAGTVWVNNYRLVSYAMPFGGFKQSGLGREIGPDALHEYTEVKSIWIDTGNPVRFPAG
ncbi:MAG: aldehyde dehydrogenase [Gammaproteobacteria bacterium]|nr:aldehyde dehydrogenase [Gammaproteobacteria bacterium]